MVNKHYVLDWFNNVTVVNKSVKLLCENEQSYEFDILVRVSLFYLFIASRDVNLKWSNQFICDYLQLLLIIECHLY